MVVGIIAVIAEGDREMISARTKAALEGAKACGVNLGGFRGVHFSADARKAGPEAQKAIAKARAADLRPIIAEIQAAGITSLGKIAAELTARQVLAARRGAWSPMQVSRVLLDREDKSLLARYPPRNPDRTKAPQQRDHRGPEGGDRGGTLPPGSHRNKLRGCLQLLQPHHCLEWSGIMHELVSLE